MLPFGVTIPATVPQRSGIPEALMNYPVFSQSLNKKCAVYDVTVMVCFELTEGHVTLCIAK